ncbi:MAG: hypothetical protein JWR44_3198, partial [Hymenobacter sp.]|nr:hypothetical protein [Hymenobacter sp.]
KELLERGFSEPTIETLFELLGVEGSYA